MPSRSGVVGILNNPLYSSVPSNLTKLKCSFLPFHGGGKLGLPQHPGYFNIYPIPIYPSSPPFFACMVTPLDFEMNFGESQMFDEYLAHCEIEKKPFQSGLCWMYIRPKGLQ